MKVLIEAYTRLNFGDDLFIFILSQRYKTVDFYIFVDSIYEKAFEKYSNIHVISEKSKDVFPLNMIEEKDLDKLEIKQELLKRVDATIVIGGSMFIESLKWKQWLLPHYDHLLYYSRFSPVFFMGCNFGPYNTQEFFDGFEELFKRSKDICFREKHSYELFKHLKNSRLETDIVFGLEKYINKKMYKNKKKKSLGISIMDLSDRSELKQYKEVYLDKLVEIIKKYYEEAYSIDIFSFCDFEGDSKAANELIDRLPDNIKRSISINQYNGDIENYLLKFSRMEKMICTRFHSIVLSLVFEQKFYPLIYSKKSTNTLKDLGYKGNVTYISNIDEMNVEKIYMELNKNILKLRNIKKSADRQFLAFDKYINEILN